MGPRWGQAPAGHWMPRLPKADDTNTLFAFFAEVAIISQLSGRMLEALLPKGFLMSHFGVLNHLSRRAEGSTPLAIARAFQVPKATMTHTLTGLVQAGLVRLEPNPADGRSKHVLMTQEGHRFREEAIARLKPHFARMAQHVDTGNLAALLPLLSELRSYLDSARDDPRTSPHPDIT
jgi:DNA-binding MarR family transcriptional regulator